MPFNTARKTLLSCCSSRAGRCAILASTLLLLGTEGLQNAVANGDTRTLKIHHTHTGEDILVTFKRDGRFDETGLAKLNHFLRDWRNHEQTKMDPRLFDVVWEVYQDVAGREPIQIISAYRSPATNAMLRRRSRGVAQFSQHMLGKAMDFAIPGVPLEQVRAAGLRVQRGGVGYYPTSGSPFVHLDVGNIRHWPRMTREQLVRVFPNGRTVHVPSDGQPLSGYALALADVQRRGSAPSQMSLASARGAGVVSDDEGRTTGGKRGFFAKLFGGKQADDDEEADGKPTTSRSAVAAKEEPAPAKLALASVPLPRTRPVAARDVTLAQTAVAAPAGRPAPPAKPVAVAASATPAQIVEARGVWRAEVRQLAQAVDAPRPPRKPATRYEVASIEPTALPRFPGQSEDEKPAESLLAFAPVEAARAAPRPRVLPTIIRSANATVVPRTAQPMRAASLAGNASGGDNPWLRGVLLSPSIHNAMGVTTLGTPTNTRERAEMIRKPVVTLAMTFVDQPETLDTLEFKGRAVSNLPTVTFGQIVASGHN